ALLSAPMTWQTPAGRGGSPLSRVLRVALPPREQLAKGPLLSVAGQSLSLLQGLAFVWTVNTARGDAPGFLKALGLTRAGARLGFMGALSVLLIGVQTWLQWYRRKTWQELAQDTEHRLRARLVAQLQVQDLEFFHQAGTGRLLQLVTEDTARIGEFVRRAGDKGVEKVVILLVSGTVLFLASPAIALVLCLPVPLFLLSSRLLAVPVADSHGAQREAAGRFAQMLENDLAGIADVKSFTAEERERRRLGTASEGLAAASVTSGSLSALQIQVTESVASLGFNAAAAYAGTLAASGRIAQARYSWILFLLPKLLSVPAESEELIRLYHRASRSAREIARVLDTEPEIRSGPVRHPAGEVRGEVAFENVSFGYQPGRRVLHDVSFRLRSGETVAIVGPTGSGKSTLLRLLLRFYDVDEGRIRLDGHDLRELDLHDLRSAVALVSQDVFLFQGTVRDNVRFGRSEASEDEVVEALLRAGALPLLQDLPGGLDAEVGERGSRLSGGERQRLAIARALLKDAPVLALDEATSHLDYETEAAVQRSMRQAAAGKSVLLIAHRLATIRHADQILVLERGRIREQGRHDDLVAARGLYASLWDLQNGQPPGARLEVRVANGDA
ncbi:MAG TPA: ABC transporter ATP-binding protein, partial [Thermoanaerobaculia bacterium]|nr:ABC transporter ATP-binding protein [Thermoanaerobaculia bacterium]